MINNYFSNFFLNFSPILNKINLKNWLDLKKKETIYQKFLSQFGSSAYALE